MTDEGWVMSEPVVYAITDRHQVYRARYFDQIRRLLAAGVDILQIREKDLPTDQIYRITEKTLRLAEGYSTRVFINERFDIALACGAYGVHLPGRAIPAGIVRQVTGGRLTIGVSTHSLREIRAAAREGADYVLFGPVFETPSKKKYGPPRGLAMLKKACVRASIPVIALGGLTPANAQSALDVGAAGIAGISWLLRSQRLGQDVLAIKHWCSQKR